jgi:hypothetical protein
MAIASCAAAGGDGVDQPAAEVAFVGRNAGEQVVERFPESFGRLHDSSGRLEARSLIGARGQEFGKAGNDGQGCLQLVGKGGELRVALTGLGFRLGAPAHSSPWLCASETAAHRRLPSFVQMPPKTRKPEPFKATRSQSQTIASSSTTSSVSGKLNSEG